MSRITPMEGTKISAFARCDQASSGAHGRSCGGSLPRVAAVGLSSLGWVLAALVLVPPAWAAPNAPTIAYPTGNPTTVKLNPTIFWSAYSRSDGPFPGDVQRNFQIQISARQDRSNIIYETDSGTGDPPDCRATARPTCLGAGMAHYVGVDGPYPGRFRGPLEGASSLAAGTPYSVRMRVQSVADGSWSPFTAWVDFTTIRYDGTTIFVSPSGNDAGACVGGGTAACASLAGALRKVAVGGTIIVQAGTYLIPRSSSGSPTAINLVDAPDRIVIRGESPVNRPVLKAATNEEMNDPGWIVFRNGDDVVFRDLVFQGNDACCTSLNAGASRFTIGLGQSTQVAPDRTSFINVSFLRNVPIVFQDNTAVAGPSNLLMKDCEMQYLPIPPSLDGDNRTRSGVLFGNASFVTLINSVFDNMDNHLDFAGFLPNPVEHVLFEGVEIYRGHVHPVRPAGLARNWTIRRHVQGDGAEGFQFSGVSSSVKNLVVENSSFARPLILCDNGGHGPVGYLVLTNNSFADPLASGGTGMLKVDQVVNGVRACDSGTTCQGATCDILDGNDRIRIAFNDFYKGSNSAKVVDWDGVGYTRCSGADDYVAWEALPFVLGSLRALAACPDGGDDAVDPGYVLPLDNMPLTGRDDLRLLPTSRLIDAGDPDTFVPVGGGIRVDVGAYESPIAPVITLLSPTADDDCAPESATTISVQVTDQQEAIDAGSIIVEVQVNGAVVPATFTSSGPADALVLQVQPSGGVPTGASVSVAVTAADTASPSHTSFATFAFRVRPAAPTGVAAG